MSDINKRVLCVGMCVMDVIHVCAEFPPEDSDKRCLSGYWQRGGNASNNCTVLRKLGAQCEFLGMLSTSPAFSCLQDDMRKRHIEFGQCPTTAQDPPFSSIILAANKGSRTIIHTNVDFPILTFEHFKKLDLSRYAWIHFEGRNVSETERMMDHVRAYNEKQSWQQKIEISVEIEKLDKDLFSLAMRAAVVFVSKDVARFMGWPTAKDAVYGCRAVIEGLQSFQQQAEGDLPFSAPFVVCPWGSAGSDGLTGAETYLSLRAVAIQKVVDSLGAGDTFVAAFIYASLYRELGPAETLDFANDAAAYKIQHQGFDAMASFKY